MITKPPPHAIAAIALIGFVPVQAWSSTFCADDSTYAIDDTGATGGANCTPSSGSAITTVTCDLGLAAIAAGGTLSDAAQVYTIYYDAGSVEQLQIFGTDGNGETFCIILDMDKSTDWDVTLIGTGLGDTFDFSYTNFDLRSWDETTTTVTVNVDSAGGDDTITLPTNNVGHVFVVDAGAGADEVHGSPLDDDIDGGTGNDTLYGEGGDDDITGGDGRDIIEGGDGQDRLDGGLGLDTLRGDGGSDIMCGGDTFDTNVMYGGSGEDYMWGGDAGGVGASAIGGDAPATSPGDRCDGTTGTVVDCESGLSAAPAFCS